MAMAGWTRKKKDKRLCKKTRITTTTTLLPYLNVHQATIGIYLAFPNPKQAAILVQNYDRSRRKQFNRHDKL